MECGKLFSKAAFPCLLTVAILLAGCAQEVVLPPTDTPAEDPGLPKIVSVALNLTELPRYDTLEMTVVLQARYANPYDMRQVALDGLFTAPDGTAMKVPGFWNGTDSWQFRFTPSQEGMWSYQVAVTDSQGTSRSSEGAFEVTGSEKRGWIQVGSWVNPDYSPHYLVYQDGTPFYGIGHCDTNNLMADGFSAESGIGMFDIMKSSGENYVVWWPMWGTSPIISGYDQYAVPNMKLLDTIVRDAEQKDVLLIFTVWDHGQLRDETHRWGNPLWSSNGFSRLGDVSTFFTDEEMWAWQENFYRYIIARWGYSPAIGMWQLVSEVNGTNAYEQTDPWHAKVNEFFEKNDPYRHPTTSSKSGDVDWLEGWRVMDSPQVHLYEFEDAVMAADSLARWTKMMWEAEAKPNWVGEFGVPGDTLYPEMFHNSIWAALSAGAAMTPAEWNDRRDWGKMSGEMNADMSRLAAFLADIPLAWWNPSPLSINSSDPRVRGWGVAGKAGGLFWVQDFTMEGKTITEIRAYTDSKTGVQVELTGLPGGAYVITPYNTWTGEFQASLEVQCDEDDACTVALPDFQWDIAFQIIVKP